ncbi:PAS domain S-box protein [Halosimplex aquaticum]|uniref:histidine kinase n=1 Tax=Halosimplex aquaticum TaxID=3026162 RepID=A0ABD5YBN8_9EURY|nr:PAS domain S-box protein [Halosimplex aquaticum]
MDRSGDLPSSSTETPAPGDASLLSKADIATVQLDSTGEILTVNDGLVNLVGYTRETLVGKALTDILASVPAPLESFLENGTNGPLTLTLPLEASNEDIVACETHLKPIASDGDRVVVGLFYESRGQSPRLDATEDRALTPSTEIAPARAFVALADALSDGIIVLDTDSQIQYANPAVERILGYTPDELVGGSNLSIIPERLRDAHLRALNRYLETGTRNIDWTYVELPGQHKDGHEVPLGISLNDFVFDGDRFFVGLFRDITSQKAAERALREREQLLNKYKEYTDDVLNAIGDVFYVLDEDGCLRRWNDTLVEVTGYTDEEIASMHALDFFGEDDHETIEDAIERGFESGGTRVQTELHTKFGAEIPYEFDAASLEDPDGEPVLAGIGRDITDQREQQRKLKESNDRLEQFAYAASHDLQEPLRMVTSYLQLIEQRYTDDLDDDAVEFIEFAVDGAERMREMIDGLLQYSRVDTQGKEFEPVDLNAVLDEVESDLQLRIEETDARIQSDDLPRVSGDRGQLRQVFQNLLKNAIEYSGTEPPRIEITTERDGRMWRIAVTDNGIGFDPDETQRIFRVFQRLHGREEHSGTGIGLALCRRIVERHGGEIWAESEPGEGSTFYFTLPGSTEQPDSNRYSRAR